MSAKIIGFKTKRLIENQTELNTELSLWEKQKPKKRRRVKLSSLTSGGVK